MTDDRALLKDAAKAAGIPIQYNRSQNHPIICTGEEKDGDHVTFWNPLLDDGDTLRLAVKLGICFGPNFDGDLAVCFGPDGRSITEPMQPDPYAATRRAIVRAAAEI